MTAHSDAAKARARERVHVFINSGQTRVGYDVCYSCDSFRDNPVHDLTQRPRQDNATLRAQLAVARSVTAREDA